MVSGINKKSGSVYNTKKTITKDPVPQVAASLTKTPLIKKKTTMGSKAPVQGTPNYRSQTSGIGQRRFTTSNNIRPIIEEAKVVSNKTKYEVG